MRLTILGCGSSPGVPRPNGEWGRCNPDNPRNRRFRASALVERIAEDGRRTVVVIDTGPDFRQQMIAAGVERIDAVVYTHAHADHVHGIDDLRTFWLNRRELIDIYADDPTYGRLMEAFGYIFETPAGSSYPPILNRRPIGPLDPFTIEGEGGPITFLPLRQHHGDIDTLGFRIGDLAYCTDVSAWPDETVSKLGGLDVLIVDALQYRRHPSHYSLGEALEWIERLGVKRAFLTHMHIPLDYATVSAETPDHVAPGHDGLVIEWDTPHGD